MSTLIATTMGICFNPFEAGQSLSTDRELQELVPYESQSLWNRAESFDRIRNENKRKNNSLNPFGTGQSLSTGNISLWAIFPLSQSLWNRAGSFDGL